MHMNRLTILLALIVLFGADSGKTFPVINTSEEGQVHQQANSDIAGQNINPQGYGPPLIQKVSVASNDSPIQTETSAIKQGILAPIVENGSPIQKGGSGHHDHATPIGNNPAAVMENGSPIQRGGSGNFQEHARPIEIETLKPIMENGSPVVRGGPGHYHEHASPIRIEDLTPVSENGSPIQRGGPGHSQEHATPIGIQGSPLQEIVTPILIRDYPETTGSNNDAFLLDGLRIPDPRTFRSIGSADLQVLNEFASWIDSNGLGNIQSRFGRSVSKKRNTRFLKSERKSFNPFWIHKRLHRKKYRDI